MPDPEKKSNPTTTKQLRYILGFVMKEAGPDIYHSKEGDSGCVNEVNRVFRWVLSTKHN